MPVSEQMPATALQFGRAPWPWPFLGHAMALRRRPLALLDSLPTRGDLAVFSGSGSASDTRPPRVHSASGAAVWMSSLAERSVVLARDDRHSASV
jgi:hypothetical protein